MKKNALLVMFLILLVSCAQDDATDNCLEFNEAPVETVTVLPADTNGAYPITVAFRVSNGCGDFSIFDDTTAGTTTTIKVVAQYEGCICTQDTPLLEATYLFEPTAPGTYTLKFLTYEEEYITETIVVD